MRSLRLARASLSYALAVVDRKLRCHQSFAHLTFFDLRLGSRRQVPASSGTAEKERPVADLSPDVAPAVLSATLVSELFGLCSLLSGEVPDPLDPGPHRRND